MWNKKEKEKGKKQSHEGWIKKEREDRRKNERKKELINAG